MTPHGRKYRGGDSHPLPLWSGILEHCVRIDRALWEFVWLLDKITEERDGNGIILGGAPVKVGLIAKDLGRHEQTIRRNLDRLEKGKYIERTRTPYGFVIRVKNSHKFHIWKRKEIANSARSDFQKSTISPPNLHDLSAEFARNKEDKAVDTVVDAAGEASAAWLAIGAEKLGTPRFRAGWEFSFAHRNGNLVSDAMERCIVACQEARIPVPKPFYDAKRSVERREVEESAAPATERPELEELPWRKN